MLDCWLMKVKALTCSYVPLNVAEVLDLLIANFLAVKRINAVLKSRDVIMTHQSDDFSTVKQMLRARDLFLICVVPGSKPHPVNQVQHPFKEGDRF